MSGRAVLGVFAHPDDESLACGGTFARLADHGAKVVLMCATRGERGGATGPAKDQALGETRVQELCDAAMTLGVSDVIILNHPDGELRWVDVTAFQAQIVMAIERYAPAAVITFGEDGLYWHADHVAVHERTTAAVTSFGPAAPPLYYVTMPQGAMRRLVDAALASGWAPPDKGFWSLTPDAFGLHAQPPSVVLDVRDWTSRKLAAIRCHRSQIGAGGPFADIDEEDARRWLGIEHFHRAAADPPAAALEFLESYAG
jgi:LmbE family N-acetylglucosaminyl deacetylase